MIGLAGHGDRYPHELSGGERQRVALARALAPEPRLVLLDEPFASLDPNLRIRLRADIVAILRSTGTPALFVTHDQAEALSIGDRVAVMREGRIEQDGPPDDVYHRPVNRFVAGFIDETAFLPVAGGHDRARPVRPRPRRALVVLRPHDVARRRATAPGIEATVLAAEFHGADPHLPARAAERRRGPGERRRTPSTPTSATCERRCAPATTPPSPPTPRPVAAPRRLKRLLKGAVGRRRRRHPVPPLLRNRAGIVPLGVISWAASVTARVMSSRVASLQ